MSALMESLDAARAEVSRLERIAATATCREIGCDMQTAGGRNCGCHKDGCCSVEVRVCSRCGDSDYGDTPENTAIIAACQIRIELERDPRAEGHDARLGGQPETSNPYDVEREPDEHMAWNDGWASEDDAD